MPDIFISEKKENGSLPKTNIKEKVSETNIPSLKIESHVHPFSSFCQNPQGFSFKDQDPNEKILLFLRKNFTTNFLWIFTSIIFFALPFLLPLFNIIMGQSVFSFIPANQLLVYTATYYLFVFAYIFVNFITWFYNISIVTTKRVVDIDFSDLVYQNVSMTKLNLIEDVNYVRSGFIRSLFDFGDVFVHTAGNDHDFDFLGVPKPERAAGIIEDLIGGPR